MSLLDPGLDLTLRPMRYPVFYEMYRAAIRNTWTVEEVDFSTDVADLTDRMSDGDRHLVKRLVAFFATGDSIVSNNLVLNLYRHLNGNLTVMDIDDQLVGDRPEKVEVTGPQEPLNVLVMGSDTR